MPTSALNTYNAASDKLQPFMDPEQAREIEVQLGNSLTLAKGTLLGEVTATPGVFAAYNNGNSNGTEVAKVILSYSVTTDGSGNISIANEMGVTRKSCPAYRKGIFATGDLTGLDAAGVTDLGRLVIGTTSSGVISVY
jgi:hypothetical protein